MSDKDDKVFEIVRKATERPRGHADHFQWPVDRPRAELGVVQDLSASLDANGAAFFFDLKGRAQHDDPPDCEAVDKDGQRIAIEVTELVDEEAIQRAQALRREREDQGNSPPVSEQRVDWDLAKFQTLVQKRLVAKNGRFPHLKDAPYPGGYVVVLHTDEAMLSKTSVEAFAQQVSFAGIGCITRAFIVISYDPEIERYAIVELKLSK